ncbi:hypothetical protein PIB30_039510 [Stylosanthes scabra]|uniref:Pectinesterase inhibitor domain-containing protein n=1 Tax=Stylosanthes scabra TaxID=79078 RepID=A0ABU6QDQ8_9FABA|nr:hypothetical protein [Stylosanthes scabra]
MATSLSLQLLLLTLLLLHTSANTPQSTKPITNNPLTDYIKSSCKATRYPAACLQSLLGHATAIRRNELRLVQTALTVSITRTQSCAFFVKTATRQKGVQAREAQAVKDCLDNMDSSIDSLTQSAKELNGLTGRASAQDFAWHMSNVQTWVSAAMTYQSTCLDGFSGPYYRTMNGRFKSAITAKVVNASQVTSNALAFVNRFASKHLTQTP